MHRATKVELLGLAGFSVALYALSVEMHMDEEGYEAMCDIGQFFSCTAVFKSSYGHILSHWGVLPPGHPLDLSLALVGMLLYGAYFIAGAIWNSIPCRAALFLAVSSSGALFSTNLLYVLKFILGDFCIVCTCFHAINFSMFALAIVEARDTGLLRMRPKPKTG